MKENYETVTCPFNPFWDGYCYHHDRTLSNLLDQSHSLPHHTHGPLLPPAYVVRRRLCFFVFVCLSVHIGGRASLMPSPVAGSVVRSGGGRVCVWRGGPPTECGKGYVFTLCVCSQGGGYPLGTDIIHQVSHTSVSTHQVSLQGAWIPL